MKFIKHIFQTFFPSRSSGVLCLQTEIDGKLYFAIAPRHAVTLTLCPFQKDGSILNADLWK